MVISIFKLPEEGKTWAEQKTGDICDCISLEYEKFFNGVGTFTAELPVNTRFRDRLEVNSVLMLDSGDALIVKNIKTTLDKITLTGYDLNGLLCDRLTLTDKEDGCDTQAGASETIIKHFVSANLVNCELDPNRNLPRFGIAEDKGRGLPGDNAMPRLQNVQELVTEICGAAKLGWRISVDGSAGNDKPIFVFDVTEQTDRAVNQSERNRVIFSAQMHNVSTMTREVGVTAAKNALFLDIDGTVVQYPKAADEGTEVRRAVAVGYDRREEYCSLTTDSLEEADYTAEAEQNMSDRMNETDSLIIDAGNPLDYGRLYDVGTIVTAYDRNRNVQLDSVISAAAIRRSGSEYSVKLTLGESKPKLLDGYQKKSEATQKTVRNESGKNVSAAGVLTEYQYLTDTSVKFNGTTYTIEKDAETGLISKISDSNGNSLEPGISAGITDAALHNAVFLAVAMARGISVVADSVLFTGQSGQWQFGGGLTGFTKRGPESQTYSGLDKSNYSSGIVAARLSKSYGSSNSLDGRTDAVVIQSNEKIDLTRFNKLRIRAVLFRNTSALTGAAYFCAGNPAAVQSGTAYDFSGWNKLGGCDIVSQNYSAPGTPTWYEVDVSRLSGEHYLNFGVSHGGNLVYTTYMDIHQIVLSTQ